jgi:hypothetical protein
VHSSSKETLEASLEKMGQEEHNLAMIPILAVLRLLQCPSTHTTSHRLATTKSQGLSKSKTEETTVIANWYFFKVFVPNLQLWKIQMGTKMKSFSSLIVLCPLN